jgi:ankyrin repeat protein
MKSLSIVKSLIEYRVNPNYGIESNNQKLLLYAVNYDAFDILQYLINECHVNINFKELNGIHLIRRALLCGNKNISDFILQYFIMYYGKKALFEIYLDTFTINSSSDILEILKILIDNDLDINEKDHNNDTFLDKAINSNNK